MTESSSPLPSGAAFRPDAPPHACPRCGQALKAFAFHTVETDTCPGGCGVWLNPGELKQVADSDTLSAIDQAFAGEFEKQNLRAALEQAAGNACPVHRTAMIRYEWNVGSGIVLDRCGTCEGIWLDAGEVEGYSQYIQNFYQNPPEMPPEVRLKLDQAKVRLQAEWAASAERAAQVAVPWDLWFIDDLRRHLIKTVLKLSG